MEQIINGVNYGELVMIAPAGTNFEFYVSAHDLEKLKVMYPKIRVKHKQSVENQMEKADVVNLISWHPDGGFFQPTIFMSSLFDDEAENAVQWVNANLSAGIYTPRHQRVEW